MRKIFYLPDVLQTTDYDCGVECAQTIMAYYGEDYTEYELEKILKVSREYGTSINELVRFFKSLDLQVWAGEMDQDKLKKLIDKRFPVILLIQAWSTIDHDYKNEEEWGHYVVACGYDDKGFIFEDPAMFGKGHLTYEELNDRWHGEDEILRRNFGIVVWGKEPYDYKNTLYPIG